MVEDLIKRIEKLEFHQQLLLNMVKRDDYPFNWIIIEKRLSREDRDEFFKVCEELNKVRLEQKAEGFVFHSPLFKEFKRRVHPRLRSKEVIEACIQQGVYVPLMVELKKNI
ncbi:hypothetical protein J2S13_001151 [Oikeobacillus pervagus]|uniref:DUF1878 family protein n=1 Tax=Oikeobacillus pervagus TaxID=1325931 RepID=A0AAJ1SYC0_9BACI|nr:DUF1878 family protein [Oikeobacillus pervagus]MDQ0214754.1 hypothetical protein [Oikeobacillus pervagus]